MTIVTAPGLTEYRGLSLASVQDLLDAISDDGDYHFTPAPQADQVNVDYDGSGVLVEFQLGSDLTFIQRSAVQHQIRVIVQLCIENELEYEGLALTGPTGIASSATISFNPWLEFFQFVGAGIGTGAGSFATYKGVKNATAILKWFETLATMPQTIRARKAKLRREANKSNIGTVRDLLSLAEDMEVPVHQDDLINALATLDPEVVSVLFASRISQNQSREINPNLDSTATYLRQIGQQGQDL